MSSLKPEEIKLLANMVELQIAARKVIAGLDSAPPSLRDSLSLVLSQWVTTLTTVMSTLRMGAELRYLAELTAPKVQVPEPEVNTVVADKDEKPN